MARGNVTFATRMSVSEGLPFVYSSLSIGLENMAALGKRQAQLDAMPTDQANNARARGGHQSHRVVATQDKTGPELYP